MNRAFTNLPTLQTLEITDSRQGEVSVTYAFADLGKRKSKILLKLSYPEFQKKQINCQDNVLSIEGERKQGHKEKRPDYLRSERSFGAFKRLIILPASIVEDKVKGVFKEGILRLTIPKAEKSKRKAVPIG